MALTQYFNLDKPARGSNFGSWHNPLNQNADKIDTALHNINTNNKDLAQEDVTEAGTPWYDIATKLLYIHNGTLLVEVVTRDQFVIGLSQQEELIAGSASVTNLHSHAGLSTQFFQVKDPTAAAGSDLPNKNYFAVPFGLFNSTTNSISLSLSTLTSNYNATKNRLAGITSDGINVTIGSLSASGDITTKGLTITAGSSGSTVKFGGGSASGEVEIVSSLNVPFNFKSDTGGVVEVKIQDNPIWHQGNMGKDSGLHADKVDDCEVDDTKTTSTNIWTAQKISSEIASGIASVGIPDVSVYATKQQLVDHKASTSTDHDERNDTRYPKKSDLFNVPVGGTILFDLDIFFNWAVGAGKNPDYISHFDGYYVGSEGGYFDGWKICTGENGTKNLIDKFVLGGGPGAQFPASGGNPEHSLQGNELPEHRHITGQYNTNTNNDLMILTAGTPSTVPELANYSDKTSMLYGDGDSNHGSSDLNTGSGATKYITWTSGKMFDKKGATKALSLMPPYVSMVYMTRYK